MSKSQQPVTLEPVTLAAYQFVDSFVPYSDGLLKFFPAWHGWALRAAFEAGASWQAKQPLVSTLTERLRLADRLLEAIDCEYPKQSIKERWAEYTAACGGTRIEAASSPDEHDTETDETKPE